MVFDPRWHHQTKTEKPAGEKTRRSYDRDSGFGKPNPGFPEEIRSANRRGTGGFPIQGTGRSSGSVRTERDGNKEGQLEKAKVKTQEPILVLLSFGESKMNVLETK